MFGLLGVGRCGVGGFCVGVGVGSGGPSSSIVGIREGSGSGGSGTSTSGSLEMSLRKFDGSNFNFWKEQMKDYLILKGHIDPVETENPPGGYKPNEWQKLDRIVYATIHMHLSESVYFTVQSCSTTFELWKTLSNTYEKKVAATKIYLIRRLYNLQMKERRYLRLPRLHRGSGTPKRVRKLKLPNIV